MSIRNLDPAVVEARRREIIERYGPWTAHNICLADGVYTIGDGLDGEEFRMRSFLQLISDAARRPLDELRILDLACGEGMYGIELARQGARVVSIEGREPNLAKVRFVKETLGLDDLELHLDDVRNLSERAHGRFDIVICSGILYHLNVPDVFTLLERVAEVCDCAALVYTHVSRSPRTKTVYRGREYWGFHFLEHLPQTTLQQRRDALWSSLEETESFWLTRASLFNALQTVGFTSVLECRIPFTIGSGDDHITLLALKGHAVSTMSSPRINATPLPTWPERMRRRVFVGQRWYYRPAKRLAARMPLSFVTFVGSRLGIKRSAKANTPLGTALKKR